MKIINILLYIWQLPQNLLGLLLWAIYKHDKDFIEDYKGERVLFSDTMQGGISLGKYIILMTRNHGGIWENSDSVNHEYGHSRQSLYLGPLYLIVIGIPSIIWASLYGRVIPSSKNGYYTRFYTEIWADKLGGVNRN